MVVHNFTQKNFIEKNIFNKIFYTDSQINTSQSLFYIIP
uniref:Uncharacterized protein n=1 Tax=Moumouvirus sp. 'Monve' TaxID=1128131 RepID=H2EFT3_9VIRU|nr:hypothetical protein mv_R781 [Moumouvirus Monve]